ncbi:TPA: hypothetical protein HA278_02075, partial [Candidatus Woesearchaeota archaeon]|nr:hypothetical protein [Candidatus Woesearchaeota archaeon]
MAEFRVGNVYAVRGALASLPHPSASPSVEYVAFDTLVGKSGKTTLGRKYIETPSLGTLLEGATLGPKLYDKGEKEREERQHTTINRIIARYSEARLREGVLARRNKE